MPKFSTDRKALSKILPPGDVVQFEGMQRTLTKLTTTELPPPATDLASTMALLNAIRALLVDS